MAKNVNPKFILGSPLDDQLDGTAANEILRGFDGNDILNSVGGKDHLFGGAGNDVLKGGTGDDHLLGGLGNDALVGGDGNDKLQGDAGNDLVIGGAGNDVLSGGAGINTFLLRPAFGKDVVVDFTAEDLLDLNGLGFANAAAAKAAMVQAGADVTLQIGTNQLVLQNLLLADLKLS